MEPNKTYLLRLIGAQSLDMLDFAIEVRKGRLCTCIIKRHGPHLICATSLSICWFMMIILPRVIT